MPEFAAMVPQGYESYWNCAKTNSGWSGVAMFTRVKPELVTADMEME